MEKSFEKQIAELRAAEARVDKLKEGFDMIEVWDPYGDDREEDRKAWLEERGCVCNRWVAHESFGGYGNEYLCPKGTKAAYEAAFEDEEEDE